MSNYNVIVVDSNGCLFGRIHGDSVTIIHKFQSNLPKTMGHGSKRFHIRRNKLCDEYYAKVIDIARSIFAPDDELIIAGVAKSPIDVQNLAISMFDVINCLNVSYGTEHGLKCVVDKISRNILKKGKIFKKCSDFSVFSG